MRKYIRNVAVIGASLMLGIAGCTLKATINQTTDTTSNITGTTSGAGWWNEDGQIKPDFKTTAFVSFNHENLRQNLAAGRGEYLVSMSKLLGIPENRQPAFFSTAQASYTQMADRDSTALLALLKDTSRSFVR